MNPITKQQSAYRVLRAAMVAGFLLMFGVAQPEIAKAATITVHSAIDVPFLGGQCNLRQAIESHNAKKSPTGSGCTTGKGDDVIVLDIIGNTIDLGSPLQAINGTLTIKPINNNVCYNLRQASYLTVDPGASLTLQGISVQVNGAEFRSIIDNNGGTLTISPNGTSGPCLFSNQNGRDRKTVVGGVLNNRNNGTTTIQDASFNESSAGDRGGAIYIDSGTVTIQRGTYNNNNAPHGGAIFVNSNATLNITSSNFSITNNNANAGQGGGIYSNGGNVNIQRNNTQTLGNVVIGSNSAGTGGGIYAIGGKLSVSGIQFLGNSASGNGGGIWLSDIVPAPISYTYFRENSAGGLGASVFGTDGSTLTISGDTFARNKGGLYVETFGTLGVINSTFLGNSANPEGISLVSGKGDVTFSTILLANLTGPSSGTGFNLSSSILRQVTCTKVTNDSNNLQQQSGGCPGSIETNLGLSSSFLAGNGGPTPTIALISGSPAIGAVPIGDCVDLSGVNKLTIDQRIFGRPATPGVCSTGAYEFGATASGPGIGGLPPGTQF
jgi:predicted outer membrane repeat protein